MNGVPLPVDAPSVAAELHRAGYRTALVGKAHFEPFLDPFVRFTENRLARDAVPTVDDLGPTAPWAAPRLRAPRVRHPRRRRARCTTPLAHGRPPRGDGRLLPGARRRPEVNAAGGGDTGAPQVHVNPIPRGWYHTDWVADRTIAWLDALDADDDWFCWMSFPDPHHPWDPPQSETGPGRLAGRPPARRATRGPPPSARPSSTPSRGTGGSGTTATLVSNYEAPGAWVPATLTADQVREVNARNAVECELIDEALGRVLGADRRRAGGTTTSTSSSPPTTASCRATSGCCSRGRTTSTA